MEIRVDFLHDATIILSTLCGLSVSPVRSVLHKSQHRSAAVPAHWHCFSTDDTANAVHEIIHLCASLMFTRRHHAHAAPAAARQTLWTSTRPRAAARLIFPVLVRHP